MTTPKTVRAPVTSDGVPVVVHTQPLDKTQELPAIPPAALECEPDGSNTEAAPSEIVDGDITVPVQSSIESTVTFEVLRRQSIKADEDKGKP
ncbi:MAG: hypothetical protein WBP56_20730 [Polyangia bacterium]